MSDDDHGPVNQFRLRFEPGSPIPVGLCYLFTRLLRGDVEAARDLAEAAGVNEAEFRELARLELEGLIRQVACALGGDEEVALRILAIANHPRWSADEKGQKIVVADRTWVDRNSVQWGRLLGITPASFRQTDFWQKVLPALQEAARRGKGSRAKKFQSVNSADSAARQQQTAARAAMDRLCDGLGEAPKASEP